MTAPGRNPTNGLVEGMLGALKPPLELRVFSPLAERATCRLETSAGRS